MNALSSAVAKMLLTSLATLVIAGHTFPFAAQQAHKKSGARGSSASRDLRKIGESVAKAVLDKDIETLLAYDRADLRAEDEVSLKNTKSDLYCYLFDTECITWGDGTWRSVYDKLSQARQLEIKVSVSSSPYDRQLYGVLLFYDATTVSEIDLRSQDFQCRQAPSKLAAWRFRLENRKWKPVTPLFDNEASGPCASEVLMSGNVFKAPER